MNMYKSSTLRQAQGKLPRRHEKLPVNRAWQQK
ncbi:MAG: hypothetical protein JWQ40_4942 [Segetibacter sp.]|nr:hypothetical protein [Segetibacter sp.]